MIAFEICSFVHFLNLLGVAPHCLDLGTVRSVTVEKFNGQDWEGSMQKHRTIRNMSKSPE